MPSSLNIQHRDYSGWFPFVIQNATNSTSDISALMGPIPIQKLVSWFWKVKSWTSSGTYSISNASGLSGSDTVTMHGNTFTLPSGIIIPAGVAPAQRAAAGYSPPVFTQTWSNYTSAPGASWYEASFGLYFAPLVYFDQSSGLFYTQLVLPSFNLQCGYNPPDSPTPGYVDIGAGESVLNALSEVPSGNEAATIEIDGITVPCTITRPDAYPDSSIAPAVSTFSLTLTPTFWD